MLQKKIWIPVVLVLIGVAIGATFWGQHIASQEPTRVDKKTHPSPEVDERTQQGGHFHADGTWHAEPHETPRESAERISSANQLPNASSEVAPAVEVVPAIEKPRPPTPSEAYQALREKYPEQTHNPHPFENVPVDLWDFEATKAAFTDHFNFYVEQGGYKPEVFESSREVRIAFAIMENIHNAAEPWFGLFTPEQCEEIDVMYKGYHEFEDVKPLNITRLRELINEGYSISDAHEKTMKEAGYR